MKFIDSRGSGLGVQLLLALALFSPLVFSRPHHYEKFFQIDGGPQYMYYYTKFYVGTPEVEQSAIIDTGSDTLAFPCDQCASNNCGTHQDPRFHTTVSRTFGFDMHCAVRSYYNNFQVCQFTKSYAEGSSLYGFLADDYIKFKNSQATNDPKLRRFNSGLVKDLRLKAEFGCTTKETGLFRDQFADGIIGLDSVSSLIKSVEVENSTPDFPKTFSFGLCFHQNGGIMSVDLRNKVGKDDKNIFLTQERDSHNPPVVVPYADGNNYYEIKTVGFELGDRRITINPIMMMIDSGTTFSHFPTEHSDAIFSALNAYCRKNRDKCGRLARPNFNSETCLELKLPDPTYSTVEDLYSSFPNIQILFAGANRPYTLRPRNYFYQEYNPHLPRNVHKICMAIKGEEQGKIILGAFSMIDYYFYFDRKDKKVMMFPEDCYLRTNQILLKRKERVLEAVMGLAVDYFDYKIGVYIAIAAALIAVGFLWWKRRKASRPQTVPEALSVFMKSYSNETSF
jgi:hypothetical protein